MATNLFRQPGICITGKDLDTAGCAHKIIADFRLPIKRIADFQLPIADLFGSSTRSIKNWQSAIGNRQ
jgi:hypothetical protein